MSQSAYSPADVYLETGSQKVFATSIEWPGWSRSGKDEKAALAALIDYASRYARVVNGIQPAFDPALSLADLKIVERLPGTSGTDFGAPGAIPAADARPLDDAEFERLTSILQACWLSLDAAAQKAVGHDLRKGPRGGGRELEEMVAHVHEAEIAYLTRLGWKKNQPGNVLTSSITSLRQTILSALDDSRRGKYPVFGPRGGKRWSARYFIRRNAWHILDHAWEIEDRLE